MCVGVYKAEWPGKPVILKGRFFAKFLASQGWSWGPLSAPPPPPSLLGHPGSRRSSLQKKPKSRHLTVQPHFHVLSLCFLFSEKPTAQRGFQLSSWGICWALKNNLRQKRCWTLQWVLSEKGLGSEASSRVKDSHFLTCFQWGPTYVGHSAHHIPTQDLLVLYQNPGPLLTPHLTASQAVWLKCCSIFSIFSTRIQNFLLAAQSVKAIWYGKRVWDLEARDWICFSPATPG